MLICKEKMSQNLAFCKKESEFVPYKNTKF